MLKEWYASWFDSPYYHLLYRRRDEKEAAAFLDRLLDRLKLPLGSRGWDLACGKGRHSRHLYTCGFDVTGTDLSASNIEYCKKHEKEGLHFFRHDMRNLLATCYFDAVFNLFTSFGYFRSRHENQRVINAAAAGLKPGGLLVLDYLNVTHTLNNLIPEENLIVGDVGFLIRRFADQQKIVKEITISDRGDVHVHREEVGILLLSDFEIFFHEAGLEIRETFGDYSLAPFNKSESSRLIFITSKKN